MSTSMRDRSLFKPHPNREGKCWWCCRDCERRIDRDRRAKKVCVYDTALALQERSNRNRRARSRTKFKVRRQFIADAIELLRARGFSFAEIGRLARVSNSVIYRYRRFTAFDTGKPCEHIERRFRELLELTVFLPIEGSPARSHHKPHPAYAELLAESIDLVERFPVRGVKGWETRRRNAAASTIGGPV